jgi:hypothetical protein
LHALSPLATGPHSSGSDIEGVMLPRFSHTFQSEADELHSTLAAFLLFVHTLFVVGMLLLSLCHDFTAGSIQMQKILRWHFH